MTAIQFSIDITESNRPPRRILFVEDAPSAFGQVRDALASRGDAWEAVFFASPTEALMECHRAPCDIVVSDMRMAEMDGATFLTAVSEQWPGTVRLVLSEATGVETAMRASRVAHQFLTKPCDPATLNLVIERACSLRDLITDPVIEELVGGIETLPAVPAAYRSLTELLAREDVAISEVSYVVERDVAFAAKVLQLVNSSFFGPAREVASVERAVSLLGSRLIQSLALVHGIFRSTEHLALPLGFQPRKEQAHAVAVAALARRIVPDRTRADAVFSAALLHDLGRLLLAIRGPEQFDEIGAYAKTHGVPLVEAEQAVIGSTHAELGAYALGIWGLPWPIIAATRYHHAPELEKDPDGLAIYVHVADALIREREPESATPHAPLDLELLAARGLDANLAQWRAVAAEIDQRN